LAEIEDLGDFLYGHRRPLRFKLFQHVGLLAVVKQDATSCSIPSIDIHTTVTRCSSLVQYHFAMVVYAETRWLRYTFKIVAVSGAWLFNVY
jgi:hypothetical protein